MLSLSNPTVLIGLTRRNARRLLLIGSATVLVGSVACKPKPGYLTLASLPQIGQARTLSHTLASNPLPVHEVKTDLSEWTISLSHDTVSAGTLTLQVHNAGTTAHVFEIEGNGMEKRTHPIAPDSTIALTFDLKPGKYEVYCPLASGIHRKMGMRTDLVVRSEM
jgi:plastocyanin